MPERDDEPMRALERRRALVVDDSEDLAASLAAMLDLPAARPARPAMAPPATLEPGRRLSRRATSTARLARTRDRLLVC
jgi:hypothetical protein